ncbi:MAG: amino acid adenylation domain-containing protein [Alphaproteobacteria bacterium]|nr:amino acid adenylation domain-containing protein [Alphaproteobacteria bacterium]
MTASRFVGGASPPSSDLARSPRRDAAEQVRQARQDALPPLEWNATAAPFPDDTLHALFSAQAVAAPQAIAVEDDGSRLSYAELDRRSDIIAAALAKRGVEPGALVGLCVERSAAMLAGILGILKAGAAYVPLDPYYPADRIAFMVEDSAAALVLTESGLIPRLGLAANRCLALDALDPSRDGGRPAAAGSAGDLAYVIYTSGSTGLPKGVQVPHRAVVNLLYAMHRELGFSERDRVLALTGISFDISVLELLLPLLFGATVIIASRAEAADGRRLRERIERSRPTLLQATPVTWRLLIEAGWRDGAGVTLLCGGEAVDPALARELVARAGRFWNVYGPTETTIWSSAHCVTRVDGPRIPIGRPLANTTFYILDAARRAVPVGATGELYIGGAGVAEGYLRRPDLTAERFVDDPFAAGGNGRMYRTGDFARWLPDGTVEFHGRTDEQVKIRGFRIEPGEIAAVLSEVAGVAQALVLAFPDDARAGEAELVGFVQPGKPAPSVETLRDHARRKLPEHMVPGRLVIVQSWPLTPNGKIDRNKLIADLRAMPEPGTARQRPIADAEERVAQLFEQVLEVRPVGPDDDFFRLGGHSLRAVRLLDLIERHFGRRLHINTLYHQGATPAYLAAILRDPSTRAPLPYLVPIGPPNAAGESGGPSIFCMHTLVEGTLFFYEALAARLAPDYRLLGVLPRGLEDGETADSRIEEMAVHCAAVLRAAQPRGPYRILGFSSGGMVAFATADRLRRDGEEVELIGLIDSYCPTGRRTIWYYREVFADRLRRLREGVAARLRPHAAAVPDAEAAAFRALRWRHRWALRIYRPRPYGAELLLIAAEETRPLFRDRFFGWERLAAGIRAIILPGGHYDLISEPGVGELASCLRAALAGRGDAERPVGRAPRHSPTAAGA